MSLEYAFGKDKPGTLAGAVRCGYLAPYRRPRSQLDAGVECNG